MKFFCTSFLIFILLSVLSAVPCLSKAASPLHIDSLEFADYRDNQFRIKVNIIAPGLDVQEFKWAAFELDGQGFPLQDISFQRSEHNIKGTAYLPDIKWNTFKGFHTFISVFSTKKEFSFLFSVQTEFFENTFSKTWKVNVTYNNNQFKVTLNDSAQTAMEPVNTQLTIAKAVKSSNGLPKEVKALSGLPQAVMPEAVISEDVISEDVISEDVISEDVISEDVISEEILINADLRFEDKIFDSTGFYATKIKPLKFIECHIVSLNDPDRIIVKGKSNEFGRAVLKIPVGTVRPAIKIISAGGRQAQVVRVYDSYWSKNIYSHIYEIDPDSDFKSVPERDIIIKISDSVCPAFNICDVIITCQTALEDKFRAPYSPPPADFYWKPGSSQGTYQSGSSIFLLGTTWDDDSWDDIIIGHEYGHFIHQVYSRNDTPGGSHNTIDKIDPRLAWSEGWATFFSCFCQGFPWYVDTRGAGVTAIDIKTPGFHENRFDIDNEISVASVLWNIAVPGDSATEKHHTTEKQHITYRHKYSCSKSIGSMRGAF
jgi:hypothetical protein